MTWWHEVSEMETQTCRKCKLPIVEITTPGAGKDWVVVDTETTADGLSYCPPDPDARVQFGKHVPQKVSE